MKNPCPVCMQHPVVYPGATTCSYHCWTISVQKAPTDTQGYEEMNEQLNQPTPSAEKVKGKPRITAKVKREVIADIQGQIRNGWDPCESTYKLLDVLLQEVEEAEKK